jgi:hypothetical protein
MVQPYVQARAGGGGHPQRWKAAEASEPGEFNAAILLGSLFLTSPQSLETVRMNTHLHGAMSGSSWNPGIRRVANWTGSISAPFISVRGESTPCPLPTALPSPVGVAVYFWRFRSLSHLFHSRLALPVKIASLVSLTAALPDSKLVSLVHMARPGRGCGLGGRLSALRASSPIDTPITTHTVVLSRVPSGGMLVRLGQHLRTFVIDTRITRHTMLLSCL